MGVNKEQLTISLTEEQKQEVKKVFGLNWDTITFDRDLPIEKMPEIKKADMNVVIAMAKTNTVS